MRAMTEFLESFRNEAIHGAGEPELARLSLIEVLEAARTGVLPEAQSASLRAMITVRLCGLPDSFYMQIAQAAGITARAAKVHLAQAAGLALPSVDKPVASAEAAEGTDTADGEAAGMDAMDLIGMADPEVLAEFQRQESLGGDPGDGERDTSEAFEDAQAELV